jgi:cytokinin dehydrogenase
VGGKVLRKRGAFVQERHSRRTFVKTLAASAVVLGFSPDHGTWITQAHADQGIEFDRLPRLDGAMHLDDPSLDAAAIDFGRLVRERPVAVLRPGSVRDLSRILRFAQEHKLRVAVRGRAHSIYGQALVEHGIAIDMSTLATIHHVSKNRAIVDAGCSWGDVLNATLAEGLTPPVTPDYLGLSVGGTLSIGGISPTTFRFGAQVDNVVSLQVVTGDGRTLWCSETRRPDLFEAALAGQGQCAIIARATLRLIPAPSSVRAFALQYRDVATALDDAERLTEDGRFSGVVVFAAPSPGGPIFILIATYYYSFPEEPDHAMLLEGLHHAPDGVQISDLTYLQYSDRVQGPFPELPHPALSLVLSGSTATAFIENALARLTPADLGAFSVIQIFAWPTSVFNRPLFRVPDGKRCVGFAVLRYATTPAMQEQMLAGNRTLYDDNRILGGTIYPFSAVQLTSEDWRLHYGTYWKTLLAAKRRFDRENILASGPDVLGECIE